MLNTDYTIDYSDWSDEGGSCQVYPIKNQHELVFKEFRSKKKAQEAYTLQKKLAEFDLSPSIVTKVCKLKFAEEEGVSFIDCSDWGFVTERAKVCDPNTVIKRKDIQKLVNDIVEKTGLKFWDCHWYNVGLVKRGNSRRVVCIDTGKESFSGDANAWGLADPGPKCSYCSKYQCSCEE